MFKGLLWLFKKIQEAAVEELSNEAQRLTVELSTLYLQLESGSMTESAFAARETEILDRLDRLEDAALGEREAEALHV